MPKTQFINHTAGNYGAGQPTKQQTLTRAEKAHQVAYMKAAQQRCREFRDLRYCVSCHLALEVTHSFCQKCGTATEPLPTTYALKYARDEFPDLVKTREDFDRLVE